MDGGCVNLPIQHVLWWGGVGEFPKMAWNEEVRVQNLRHLVRKSKPISPGDDVKSGLRSLVCYQTAVMSGILGVVTDVDYIMQIPCYFISAPVDIPVALKVSTSKAANKNKRPRNLNIMIWYVSTQESVECDAESMVSTTTEVQLLLPTNPTEDIQNITRLLKNSLPSASHHAPG